MSITDKELLTINNLSNLQMEYANIIKERKSIAVYNDKGEKTGDKELIINHTISTIFI